MKIHDSLKNYRYRALTKSSADVDKPARRVWRPVKHQAWYILYVRYGFLLVCYKSVRHTVFEIFDFKNAVTLKTELGVRHGRWKCHHSKEHYDFLLTFYSNYVSISCRFWDIQC